MGRCVSVLNESGPQSVIFFRFSPQVINSLGRNKKADYVGEC